MAAGHQHRPGIDHITMLGGRIEVFRPIRSLEVWNMTIRYRRGRILALAAVIAVALVPSLPSTVLGAPGGSTGGGRSASAADDPQLIDNQDPALLAQMRAQERLHPAAQALLEAASKLPSDSGFAGVGYEREGVALYYKGALPAPMGAAVAAARRTAPVFVTTAAYSRAELEQAQAILTAAVERNHSDIQAIGVAGDGSGLAVERMPAATAATRRTKLAARHLASKDADALLAELRLDVPITVTTAAAPIEFLASRENDFAPWNGGGQFETWRQLDMRSPWCTTGFGVWKGGQSYVLTADHCMTAPDRAYNGHFGGCCFEEIGPVYQSNWDKDILLINARGSALMFDGGVNSNWTKTVHSWGYRVNTELLCTSGSRSGVICGDKTNPYEWDIGICDSDGDCFTIHDMARADNINGRCVGVNGDSGGPVFSLHGTGVRAKGTISARNTSNCTILYFQDMDEIVGSLGATPRTA
jgi:streptogrisin D